MVHLGRLDGRGVDQAKDAASTNDGGASRLEMEIGGAVIGRGFQKCFKVHEVIPLKRDELSDVAGVRVKEKRTRSHDAQFPLGASGICRC